MKKILIFLILILTTQNNVYANNKVINQIKIEGNERIPKETIILFSNIKINDKIDDEKINDILKDLYDSNFFENISIKFDKNTLIIKVTELPIINKISITGIKAKKIKNNIFKNFSLKERNSFSEFLLKKEIEQIKFNLKNLGYYFAKVEPYVENLDKNLINLEYKITLGEKAKIKKISFIGDKIFKDRKLRNLIVSEEYKFWKFISNKKFLNEEIINIDQRLLKNYYLNKGYYNVIINTSFAKLVNDEDFELIFNIKANNKIYFNNLEIIIPDDFDKKNYINLNKLLSDLKGKSYSINAVEEILEEIDKITLKEEFKSINASIDEKIIENNLNIKFTISEGEKYFVEKINIFGNNVTRESVIRNELEIDEGDPFSQILAKKSENNIKSLNFFKSVDTSILEGKNKNSKILNITVQEKPTGEISAGAGVGTSGGTLAAGVKENNYLGKGLRVEAKGTLTQETFKGLFSVTNPNFNNSDKSLFVNFQALETDQLNNFGYKTNKTGFEIGTNFEYLKDLNLGLSTSSFYEVIETSSTASTRQKSQAGNYWDTFSKVNFFYDKRNQKFKTSDGFFSNYVIDIPIISETNTLTNRYSFKIFEELYENNISSFSVFLSSANSITGDDIKLSERLFIPSRKLRGFEAGKVGPKDGNDFIGGNYITSINLNTTLPQLFPNAQNLDATVFIDAANIWGVDYNSSLSDGSKIRSSIGFGIDWFTLVGPLNFSFSQALTKEDTDVEESFRFNLGTTF